MIPAKPTAFGRWFWETTARIGIKLQFRGLALVNPVSIPPRKSVILIGNHISWWDGFLALELNRSVWKKEFHVMMLEQQLSKRPFMRKTGAFSVNPGSRDTLLSIRYSSELLERPENLVLIFPQGKIHSQYDRTFKFETGIQKIVNESKNAQVVFFASFFDFGSHSKPIIRLYTQLVTPSKNLAEQYREFYTRSESDHVQIINE